MEKVMGAAWGVEHPQEEFEFARFCLLEHYRRDEAFLEELQRFADAHADLLSRLATAPTLKIPVLADYRMAWGWLSFLESRGQEDAAAYRKSLATLATKCGLTASWCAPSLHMAILAMTYAKATNKIATLTPCFTWEDKASREQLGRTVVSLPRLLVQDAQTSTRVETLLVGNENTSVHYDPRLDPWDTRLREVRRFLGRKRLSATTIAELKARRLEIETAFQRVGYLPRARSRILDGEHKLARWTFWTFLALRPPRKTTDQILPVIGKSDRDTQHVDQAIKHVLNLLDIAPRTNSSNS